ncbi:hypothetical protein BaRGS_00020257, partial [Batillaria attramentaria]
MIIIIWHPNTDWVKRCGRAGQGNAVKLVDNNRNDWPDHDTGRPYTLAGADDGWLEVR